MNDIDRGEYPDNWEGIASLIKDLAHRTCEGCNHPHDVATHHVLTVHHLDRDKANCDYANLVALCQRCHLSVQASYMPGQQWLPGTQPRWSINRDALRIGLRHYE